VNPNPEEMTDDELAAWAAKRDEETARKRAAQKKERLRLAFRFEKELGTREGVGFFVHDATDIDEGFFVVKLGDAIRWKEFIDAPKVTEAHRYDLLEPVVVHPAREVFQAAFARRHALGISLCNKLGELYGLKLKADEGK
jgi:hypothetical protein